MAEAPRKKPPDRVSWLGGSGGYRNIEELNNGPRTPLGFNIFDGTFSEVELFRRATSHTQRNKTNLRRIELPKITVGCGLGGR